MKISFSLIIGILAVVLGMGLIVFNNKNTSELDYPPATISSSVEVANQVAGEVVTINMATLDRPGFVVIREANGTRLGEVLAASPILATGENRSIFINAKIISGKEYYAVLYSDNGNSTFSERTDEIVEDVNGVELKAKFRAL